MLDEGLLDVPSLADGTPSPVTGAFALHITSTLPTGTVATKGGAAMASADTFHIVVHGSGGHASEPFRAIDPIPIACEIVQALQLMVTRRIDIFDPAVVTVGQITAGTTNNIIPDTATIIGTIRTVSERTRADVHDNLRRVAERIAEAHGATAEPEIDPRVSGHEQRPRVRRLHARRGRRRDRRRERAPHAQPDHGRRGLLVRAAARARHDAVPRRHAPRPRPAHGRRQPLEPASLFDEEAMVDGVRSTRGWRSVTSALEIAEVQPVAAHVAVRRSVTISNGRTVTAQMPSPTSIPACGSSSRLHRLAAAIGRSQRTVTSACGCRSPRGGARSGPSGRRRRA